MTDIDLDRLEELHAKATPGEWESDCEKSDGCYGSGEDCHEGYQSYAMFADGKKLFDALNSDVGCVHEEFDEDGCYAWDDVAKRNMEFVAAAKNAFPSLLAAIRTLTKERDEARGALADQGDIPAIAYLSGAADARDAIKALTARAEAAEAEAKALRELLKPTINEKMEKKLRGWAEAMQASSDLEGTALEILLDNNAKRRTALEASR